MATNGQLVFTDVDKVTFKGVGDTSNAVIDTTTGKIGVGVDSPDANLHVLGNCFVSTNFELGGTMTMGTVTVRAQHELSAITATGNTTPHTVEFQNATTGFVTTGNVSVGKELTVSGNVEVGTANLFVDTVNSRVGVGTTAPNTLLELSSATGSATITPTELRLSTTTNASDWDNTNPWGKISFYSHDTSNGGPQVRGAIGMSAAESFGGYGRLGLFTENAGTLSERVSIKTNGNVGIGTTDPGAKLTIGPTASLLFADNRSASNARNWAIRVNNSNEGDFQIGYTGGNTGGLPNFYATPGDAKVTISKDGNVGIGTTDPQGGLHMSGKTFILGQIASAPNGPDGTMYYNSTTQQPLVKVSGSWTPLVNFLPSHISGLVGWYLPENWTGSQWSDLSGSGNHVTAYEGTIQTDAARNGSADGANAIFPVLYGSPTAELNFPSAILPSTYTLISLTRYNGSTKKRILDGQIGNWLSGHWGGSSGSAYHNGWLTTTSDRHGDKWVIGVDQNSLYRSKSQSVAWTNDTGGGGTSTNLRLGSVDYEGSDWMCAELIVYNRTLSSDEYTLVSDYIQNKFGIY